MPRVHPGDCLPEKALGTWALQVARRLEQALSQLRDHWGYFEYEKKISQLRDHRGYFEYEKSPNNLFSCYFFAFRLYVELVSLRASLQIETSNPVYAYF